MTSIAAPAPVVDRPSPADLAAAGREADALELVPPCTCGDCRSCDDDLAAMLAEALGIEDDGPDLDEARAQWAAISGLEYARRQRRLAQYREDGRRMALAGTPLAVSRLLADGELADAIAQGHAEGLDELAEAMPLSDRLLDEAERMGWEGDDLWIPGGLRGHHIEAFVAAWAEGRRQRDLDEEELALGAFDRYVATREGGTW